MRPLISPSFVRLWAAGGIANSTLWLEILAASLFTFEVTGSGWAVALVSSARAVPLLLFGALAGVASDAWNRKTIVVAGLLLSAASAAAVAILAGFGRVAPWHLAAAALVSGLVYATEMPARRRMIAESAGPAPDRAVAVDSLTSYAARCLGPLLAGAVYSRFGLVGAFLISAASNLSGALIVAGMTHSQVTRPLPVSSIRGDLREAFALALRTPSLLALMAVTVTMNLCGYSYSTLVTPVAKNAFHLDSSLTGVLAAAEPAGAFLTGAILIRFRPPGSRLGWLMGGVAILTTGLIGAAALGAMGAPLFAVCAAFGAGGIGSAIYTNNQTSLVVAETPPALRSRMMGLVALCIGSWPLGMLLAGGLVQVLPPLGALAALAGCGLALVVAIAAACAFPHRIFREARQLERVGG